MFRIFSSFRSPLLSSTTMTRCPLLRSSWLELVGVVISGLGDGYIGYLLDGLLEFSDHFLEQGEGLGDRELDL